VKDHEYLIFSLVAFYFPVSINLQHIVIAPVMVVSCCFKNKSRNCFIKKWQQSLLSNDSGKLISKFLITSFIQINLVTKKKFSKIP